MMEGIKQPKTLKFYQLLRVSTKAGLNISYCGTSPTTASGYVGLGFYTTLQEAEHNRTLEVLRDTDGAYNSYHVFELEFPNPAYRE